MARVRRGLSYNAHLRRRNAPATAPAPTSSPPVAPNSSRKRQGEEDSHTSKREKTSNDNETPSDEKTETQEASLPCSEPGRYSTASLKMQKALQFIKKVRQQFSEKPEEYDAFIKVLHEFRSSGAINAVDTTCKQVRRLFKGKPDLIEGFEMFIPPCHRGMVYRA